MENKGSVYFLFILENENSALSEKKNNLKYLSHCKGDNLVNGGEATYLSYHMFPIDKGFEPADCRTLPQWEDVLGLDGHSALVGVLLENDDLLGGRSKAVTPAKKTPSPTTPSRKR